MNTPLRQLNVGSPSQRLGQIAEQDACHTLVRAGHRIIARNYLCRTGEIDIISVNHHGKLVLSEVRWRRSQRFGGAPASVNAQKQRKIIKTAAFFLRQQPHYATFCIRFDVFAYSGTPPNWQREWIRHAFSAL